MKKKKIINPYKSIAIITQTKQIEGQMWPAVANNQNHEINYIIVCCEPSMNGVYQWNKETALKTGRVYIGENNRKPIFMVPYDLCAFCCKLEDITDEKLKAKIIEVQNDWYNGDITNHEAGKYKKRDWYLDRD